MLRAFSRAIPRTLRAAEGTASEASGPIPEKLQFNLLLPSQAIHDKEDVHMVMVPGVGGIFGVLPGHVPTVAELKPGVVSVQKEKDGESLEYFVSGGFAIVHKNHRADVMALECVPVADLDAEAVRKGMTDYEQKVASATSDEDKTAAEIGVEVHRAMQAALGIV